MLRDTMIRTMPVAMIAIEALWTDRFHRFLGVMKLPPERMLKKTQITARATIMPSRRVSSSSAASVERKERPDSGSPAVEGVVVTSLIRAPLEPDSGRRSALRRAEAAGAGRCHQLGAVVSRRLRRNPPGRPCTGRPW